MMEEKRYIDLRSDTVTQPTKAMREAMWQAAVGDDVYQDDPTTNLLEAEAARILGKEAAMFVTSGTMGNQLGIMSQTRRGDEIIVGAECHIFLHEVGAVAVLSGVNMRQLPFPGAMPDAKMIEAAIRPDDIHEPPTALICLENALAGGKVVPVEVMKEVWDVAKAHDLPVHMDGARVFNAAVALGVDVKEITQYCDTLSCCLSKGLCAPVGAIFAGPKAVVDRARRFRKMLGGGMRQNGILAAAGLIALKEMPARLQEDHENAKYLAEKLAAIPGIHVMMDRVQVDMVFFTMDYPMELQDALPDKMLEKGIKVSGLDLGEMRWVCHNDISREDLDYAVDCLKEILA